MPATSFPAAGGDPAAGTESQHLDGALIAATIASLWVLLRHRWSDSTFGLDWAVTTYAPILLVALVGALLVRQPTSPRSIAANLAAYGGLAMLMGVMRATSPVEVIFWGAFFALLGLITAVLCVVAWAAVLYQLAAPRTPLYVYTPHFRLACMAVILAAALVGADKAIAGALAGLS